MCISIISHIYKTKYLDKKQISSFVYCTDEVYKLILSTIYIQSNTANQQCFQTQDVSFIMMAPPLNKQMLFYGLCDNSNDHLVINFTKLPNIFRGRLHLKKNKTITKKNKKQKTSG